MSTFLAPRGALTVFATSAILLTACGGGGGSTQPALAPLSVTAVSPAAGATSDIAAVPSVTFDDAMAGGSGDAAIVLKSPIGQLDAVLSRHGNVVDIAPTQTLVWGTHYQLDVADTLRSASGRKLASPYSSGFDTRMPVWSAVSYIDQAPLFMDNVKVGSTGNGDVIAIWQQSAGTSAVVMASRYAAATKTWRAAVPLQGNNNRIVSLDLAVNQNGVAWAVWDEKQDGGNVVIKAARSNAAGVWGAPVTISKADGASSAFGAPRIAIDPSGNAVASWKQYHTTDVSIDAAYYNAAAGMWNSASSVQTGLGEAAFPRVAMDRNGNATVSWSQSSTKSAPLLANVARYDAAAGKWESPKLLQSDSLTAGPVDILFDVSGNAMALWLRTSANGTNILTAARYQASSHSWAPQHDLPGSDKATSAQYGIDPAGNVMAAWIASAPDYLSVTIHSQRYLAATDTWVSVPDLSPSALQHGGYVRDATLSVDPAGNAVIAWSAYAGNGDNRLYASRYSAADGRWGEPATIDQGAPMPRVPAITVDQNGQAMLAWPRHVANDYSSALHLVFSRLSGT